MAASAPTAKKATMLASAPPSRGSNNTPIATPAKSPATPMDSSQGQRTCRPTCSTAPAISPKNKPNT